MTRMKFLPTFKAEVVIEAIKEDLRTAELVQKYSVTAQQLCRISNFLKEADSIFATNEKSAKMIAEEEKGFFILILIIKLFKRWGKIFNYHTNIQCFVMYFPIVIKFL